MDAELDSKAPAALELKGRPYKTAIRQRRYLLTGFKLWRFKLYFERREKALTVGAFPAATRKAERAEPPTLRPRAKGVRLVMTLENSLTIGTPRQILNLTPKQTGAVRAFLLSVETEGTRHAAD